MEGEIPEIPTLKMSDCARRTRNLIREVVDKIKAPEVASGKSLIPLSIGDPTTFGNIKAPDILLDAVSDAVKDHRNHGYKNSAGCEEARIALAKKYSYDNISLELSDIIVTSGCSGALEIAMKSLANPGDNILVPCPGFPLYKTILLSNGIVPKEYQILPEANWRIDLEGMEKVIDRRTRAILINNPSNPCGSVFEKDHLQAILKIAERYYLPVIADEIYGELVFQGKFHPLASLTNSVPILSAGGTAKEYLVPGFRIGWLICYNNRKMLSEVWQGALKLTTVILGANTIVQPALKVILTPPKGSKDAQVLHQFHNSLIQTLRDNADVFDKSLGALPCITVLKPRGAMYMMLRLAIKDFDKRITDDISFTQMLLEEENVSVLPGSCFGMKDHVRIILSPPRAIILEACSRIRAFCLNHTRE